MKHKILSRILVLVLALCLTAGLCMTAFAAEPTVSLTASASRSGKTVTVVVSATSTHALEGLSFDLDFPEDKLTYVSASKTGKFGMESLNKPNDKGYVRYGGVDGSDGSVDVNGTILTITFEVKDGATGSASFTFAAYSASYLPEGADDTVSVSSISGTGSSTVLVDYTVSVGTVTNGTVTTSPSGVVAPGATVTVTATPNEGYELDKISATQADGTAVTVSGNTFTMPSANVTVTATFKLKTYTVTVGSVTNGTVAVDKTSGNMGDTITITATPNTGFNLSAFSVTDASGKAITVTKDGNKATFKMPASNVTVSATFAGKSYDITKESVTGGKLEAPASASYGASVTITATPNKGWKISSITVTDAAGKPVKFTANGNKFTFTMPDSAVKISGKFEENVYNITAGTGTNGTYTVSAKTAKYGEKITIKATAASGYYVSSVSVKDANGKTVNYSGSSGNYSFTMPDSNVTVSVSFAKVQANTYKIEVQTAEGGAVSADKEYAAAGASVTVKVTANAGYEVSGVSVTSNGKAVAVSGSGDTYTFTMPSGGVTVAAEFAKLTYNITVEEAANATVKVSVNTAAVGDNVTLDIAPDAGYALDTITVLDAEGNTISLTLNNELYTFVMPGSDVTVSVLLKEVPTEPTTEPVTEPTTQPTVPTTQPTEPNGNGGNDGSNNIFVILLLCISVAMVIVAVILIVLTRRKKDAK